MAGKRSRATRWPPWLSLLITVPEEKQDPSRIRGFSELHWGCGASVMSILFRHHLFCAFQPSTNCTSLITTSSGQDHFSNDGHLAQTDGFNAMDMLRSRRQQRSNKEQFWVVPPFFSWYIYISFYIVCQVSSPREHTHTLLPWLLSLTKVCDTVTFGSRWNDRQGRGVLCAVLHVLLLRHKSS